MVFIVGFGLQMIISRWKLMKIAIFKIFQLQLQFSLKCFLNLKNIFVLVQ